MKIEIPLLSIAEQQKVIFQAATEAAINQLKDNLNAPRLPGQTELNENLHSRKHLLREHEGWEPPSPDLIGAYFRHFQEHFPAYGTDGKLAPLLGVSSDRRVRDYKQGSRKMPYGVWRKFLVMTGRVPQDIVPVLAFMV